MPKSRLRKKVGRRPTPPTSDLERRLARGERIDLGEAVLTVLDLRPSYFEDVQEAKSVIYATLPDSLGFDPFEELRRIDAELDPLVDEIDDWLRLGNHVRCITSVSRFLRDVNGDLIMRTGHRIAVDDMPVADWARRTARIVGDLRSHLDHVVYDLTVRAAQGPLTEEERRASSFPIDDADRPQSLDKLRRKLPYLAEESRELILATQPTQAPADVDPRATYMWLLNKLNNDQKHRAMSVAAIGHVTERGPESRVFGEGEILIPAVDMMGDACLDGCHLDVMILYGDRDATQFRHEDGAIEALTPLCRFLREAFSMVVLSTQGLYQSERFIGEMVDYADDNS